MSALLERTLALLDAWTPIRSTAAEPAELRRMGAAVTEHLRTMGGEIVAAGQACAPPLVHARFDRGAATTLLLYNMYDVMPAEEDDWSVPPFRGGIVDLPAGRSYVGRGAENNKGPLAGMLVALEALLPTLAANVEVLVEGEEEVGSPGLRRYLAGGTVRPARVGLFPSFCEYGGGPPRVYLGSKGIAHGRVRLAAGAWGGPHRAAHSSNAPWIANPAWGLVQALAAVAPGVTGALGRVPLPPALRPVLTRLAAGFDPADELRFRTAETFALSGNAEALLEHCLTAASLNLSQLHTEPAAARAVIPAAAEARFDLRLPPGMAPKEILATLRARAPAPVEWIVEDSFPGHSFGPEAPGVAALCDCYQAAGMAPQLWPWAIGAMPAYAFAPLTGSFLIGGLGRGGNAHGTDEFVTLAGLQRYLDFLLAWLPATVAEPA